jgi:hypothetical protein
MDAGQDVVVIQSIDDLFDLEKFPLKKAEWFAENSDGIVSIIEIS